MTMYIIPLIFINLPPFSVYINNIINFKESIKTNIRTCIFELYKEGKLFCGKIKMSPSRNDATSFYNSYSILVPVLESRTLYPSDTS